MSCGLDLPVSSPDGAYPGATENVAVPACGEVVSSGGALPGGGVSSSTGFACPDGAVACQGAPPPEPPSPPSPPPPAPPAPTGAQALAATAQVRDALDLGNAPTRVDGFTVVVEPLAGDLPTSGLPTVLQLWSQARLVGATGWLSTGREAELYPLRSAREALGDVPVVALGAPCDALGCPDVPAVTGARLGLTRVALDGGAAALLPAWLFDVKGSPVPLVALAVADRFLLLSTTDPGIQPGVPDPGLPGPGVPDRGAPEPAPVPVDRLTSLRLSPRPLLAPGPDPGHGFSTRAPEPRRP